MIKILFLIRDLGQGGAEKVLVNLVNNMDRSKFDISVTVLFGGGVNEQFLAPDIHFKTVFEKSIPGNSKLMKILSPKQLHKLFIKEHYDIEVAYLEGVPVRVISGCTDSRTKLVAWTHCTLESAKAFTGPFRNYKEAAHCYKKIDHMVFVSKGVKNAFLKCYNYSGKMSVLYNTLDSDKIRELAKEQIENNIKRDAFSIITVGTLKEVKGYDRLLRIIKRLKEENYQISLIMLGVGTLQSDLERFIKRNNLGEDVTLLGYQMNPYKYLAQSDLFVCSSYAEGFSTAATEALIIGIPVCTVEVSGMKEMLGENNEYGIVTKNNEEALYQGIKCLLDEPELLVHYQCKAIERGNIFSKEVTVRAVEDMFWEIMER